MRCRKVLQIPMISRSIRRFMSSVTNVGSSDVLENEKLIPEAAVRVLSQPESDAQEIKKVHHMFSQEGPYLGSKMMHVPVDSTQERSRRSIVRVPYQEPTYAANETSFRRLPRDIVLPSEWELRSLYPQRTLLELHTGEAHCADLNSLDIDEEPAPIPYSMLLPPNWSKEKQYPYLVVLPDGRGTTEDFEDVCANMFERPLHRQLMLEQEWVVVSPIINMRFSFQIPVEGVVARFCDWVAESFNVEHGKVHLMGKGLGAYTALRTCLEQSNVALSVVGILGRNGSPFRPMDRAQHKVKHFHGVHTLVFTPGLLRKQDYFYKFKFMMDLAKIRPAVRNVHFADVQDHQVYYAINPIEFWNHMKYFRQYNTKMIAETHVHR